MEGGYCAFRGLHRGFFALRVARVPRPADAARDRERLRAHARERADELGDPAARYVSMMRAAAEQMGELLDALGVATRIEAGRYEPALIEADSLELVQAAAERLGEKAVASGSGATVRVDRAPVEAGLAGSRSVRRAPRRSRAGRDRRRRRDGRDLADSGGRRADRARGGPEGPRRGDRAHASSRRSGEPDARGRAPARPSSRLNRSRRRVESRSSLLGSRPEQYALVAEGIVRLLGIVLRRYARTSARRVGRRRDFASSSRMRSISPARPMRAPRHWSTVRTVIEQAWHLFKRHWFALLVAAGMVEAAVELIVRRNSDECADHRRSGSRCRSSRS